MKKRMLSLALAVALIMTALPMSAFAATRESEPNDSSSQATEMQLNTEYVGNLSSSNGNDWYKFTLSESDMVSITFNYTNGNPRMRMNWYDSGNKTVASEVRLWLDSNIYPLTTSRFNLAAGTYYIHIKGYSQEGGNSDYYLTVNAENAASVGTGTTPTQPSNPTTPTTPTIPVGASREVEPNNASNQATLLPLNTDMYGNLSDRNDKDWYKFTLLTNGLVTLGYSFTGGHPGMRFQLHDSAGIQMDEWIFTSSKNTILPLTSHRYRLPAGDYYLYVGDYSTESRNEDYMIRVNFTDESAGGFEIEYNDSASAANTIAIGATITGNLTDENDKDYHAFVLTQATSVSVKFEYTGGNPRMRFSILNSAGAEVYKTDDLWKDATVYPYITQKVELVPGTYYIAISDYSVSRTNRDYRITVLAGDAVAQPDGSNNGSSSGASSWAVTEVEEALSLGFVPSELQNDYQNSITRAEYCRLVIMMLMCKSGALNNEDAFVKAYNIDLAAEPFNDTSDRFVKIAYCLQIVNGTGNGQFSPNSSITRQDAATMIKRAAAVFEFTTSTNQPVVFSDKDAFASYAAPAVDFVSAIGVMAGVGNNMFSPHGSYTREQSILTMVRLYKAFPRDNYAL